MNQDAAQSSQDRPKPRWWRDSGSCNLQPHYMVITLYFYVKQHHPFPMTLSHHDTSKKDRIRTKGGVSQIISSPLFP